MKAGWKAAVAVLVLAAGALAGGDAKEIEPGGVECNRFLFFATLEGACEDALSKDAVKAILEQDEKGRYRNFVYACPVCAPVVEGVRAYAMREEYYYARKGDPLVGDPAPMSPVAAGLADPAARGGALSDLVQGWVKRAMERRRFTDAEKSAWRQALALGRKKGMGSLPVSEGFAYKSCPSCDGATGTPWEAK